MFDTEKSARRKSSGWKEGGGAAGIDIDGKLEFRRHPSRWDVAVF